MSFFITPVRRLCIIRAIAFAVLGVAILCLSYFLEPDAQGRAFAYAFAAVSFLVVGYNVWAARTVDPEATVTPIPELAGRSEQVDYYHRNLRIAYWLTIPASAWIGYELHQLDTHQVRSVRLHVPIGYIYEHFGFWPAVMFVPALMIAAIFIFRRKIRQLQSTETKDRAS